MKIRGYAQIKRHPVPGNDDGRSASSDPVVAANIALVQALDQVSDGPASALPPDHPLALRHWQARSRIYDVKSWNATIQVGGTELAVA
jgi:hypothetical protein